eukprot:TRINITY_DN6749_c0_g3_i1.p2 TRINITY_DN6749_c0_g3~~TRINITY_DN6749_c0_g3_i1.p2  ORF type:complete len:297 (-),score=41.94 TRINITY_DN6749_c0_g3_i1:574-1416(-)
MISWTGKVQYRDGAIWGCGRYERNFQRCSRQTQMQQQRKFLKREKNLIFGAFEGTATQQGGTEPPEQYVEVFPRIGEKDPYRVLGISTDADFEEVQDARNYLYNQYKPHEASREKIEWAFDKILSEKYSERHKLGFRPPRRGKKGEAVAQKKRNLVERFKDLLEPDVPTSTLINEGIIYIVLATWAAIQVKDPTLPLLGGFIYCTYKLFQKRQRRNPDGPFLGGSPLFGALGAAMLSLILGGLFIGGLIPAIIPKAMLPPLSAVNFFLVSCLGIVAIFFK